MSKKRPTIKGKGADIFLGEEPKELKEIPLSIPKPKESKIKATFYIYSSLLDKLDEVWLKLRKENRKLRKSDIISEGLEKILKEYKKME